jgi:rod shape-determining protein MreD
MARTDRTPGIRPRATWGRRLDIAARHSFPGAVTILLMLFTEVPFSIQGQSALLPAVCLTSVWFWSVFRPASMPPPLVFLIGVLLDLLGYMPLGTGVLTLLILHGIALRWRRFLGQQGFALVWLAFALVAVGAAMLDWAIVSLLSLRFVPIGPALFQAAVSGALYPALAIPLTGAHASVANPERA